VQVLDPANVAFLPSAEAVAQRHGAWLRVYGGGPPMLLEWDEETRMIDFWENFSRDGFYILYQTTAGEKYVYSSNVGETVPLGTGGYRVLAQPDVVVRRNVGGHMDYLGALIALMDAKRVVLDQRSKELFDIGEMAVADTRWLRAVNGDYFVYFQEDRLVVASARRWRIETQLRELCLRSGLVYRLRIVQTEDSERLLRICANRNDWPAVKAFFANSGDDVKAVERTFKKTLRISAN
jgi:hypothetical protein